MARFGKALHLTEDEYLGMFEDDFGSDTHEDMINWYIKYRIVLLKVWYRLLYDNNADRHPIPVGSVWTN